MSSPWSRRRGTATSLTAVSDRPGLVGRLYCPLRSLPGSPDGGQGLSIDVLPCYLCACMLATGICHVFPPWPRGRGCVSIWPWVMSVTQGRDGEGNREIRGRQPMFSIHISWQRPGWKEMSRLPRYLAASPSFPRASSGRPRWPANTGWEFSFFGPTHITALPFLAACMGCTAWHVMGAKVHTRLVPGRWPVLQALTLEAAYAMLGSHPITRPAVTCFFFHPLPRDRETLGRHGERRLAGVDGIPMTYIDTAFFSCS